MDTQLAGIGRSTSGVAMPWRILRGLRTTHPMVLLSWLVILIGIGAMIFAPLVSPFPPNKTHLIDALARPNGTYWLGTDDLGRDILSRIIYGARTSLLAGFIGTVMAVAIGSTVGMVSGLMGGWAEMMLQRLMDGMQCIPGLIFAMFVVLVLGPSVFGVAFAVGLTLSPRVNRIVRAASLEVVATPYVEAARSIGASEWRVLARYVLPNVAAPIIVMFSLSIGATILTVSALDFLGLGIKPPTPTWGGMLGGNARTYFLSEPTMAFFPGLVVALTVWAFNTAGDDLRDRLDPTLRLR